MTSKNRHLSIYLNEAQFFTPTGGGEVKMRQSEGDLRKVGLLERLFKQLPNRFTIITTDLQGLALGQMQQTATLLQRRNSHHALNIDNG